MSLSLFISSFYFLLERLRNDFGAPRFLYFSTAFATNALCAGAKVLKA
ncbi:MAG: hypothetical protein ACO1NO_07190 [Burkholderiaceae bacterium]